jgi:hypothetical protein
MVGIHRLAYPVIMKEPATPTALPASQDAEVSMIILHDGDATEAREKLSGRLAAMFHIHANTRIRVWSFHQLERLDFRAMASRLAKKASVLAVAATGHDAPPHHVRRWIEHACRSVEHAKPVLISLEPGAFGCAAYLHALSSRWGTPCLCAPAWPRAHRVKTEPFSPPEPPHETHTPPAGRDGRLSPELMHRLPGHLPSGQGHALLQHLAQLPEKRLNRAQTHLQH